MLFSFLNSLSYFQMNGFLYLVTFFNCDFSTDESQLCVENESIKDEIFNLTENL